MDSLAGFPAGSPDRPVLRIGLAATYARWKGHEVFLRAAAAVPRLSFLLVPSWAANFISIAAIAAEGSDYGRSQVGAGKTVNVEDAYDTECFDFSGTKAFDANTGYRSKSFLTVPLKNHDGDVVGVLQLINARDANGTVIPFPGETTGLVEALDQPGLLRRQLVEQR